jgi:hypothetical protein
MDWYTYQAFKTTFPSQTWVKIGYWIFSVLVYSYIVYGFLTFSRENMNPNFGTMVSLMILSLVPKLIILTFLFGEDIARFFLREAFNLFRVAGREIFYPIEENSSAKQL